MPFYPAKFPLNRPRWTCPGNLKNSGHIRHKNCRLCLKDQCPGFSWDIDNFLLCRYSAVVWIKCDSNTDGTLMV